LSFVTPITQGRSLFFKDQTLLFDHYQIAVTAPFVFLMANGYSVNLDEEQAFQLIVGALEQSDFTRGHLEKWICDNAK